MAPAPSVNPDARVRFSFTLTKQDLVAFQRLANRRLTVAAKANSRLLVANLLAWLPLGVAIAAYAAMYRKYPNLVHDLNVVLVVLVLGGVLLVVSVLYKQYIYRNALFSEASWVRAKQTIEADSEGLKIDTVAFHSLYEWSAFVHRVEDATNLYLFIDNAQALIVPKSAIGPPDKLAQFQLWSRIGEP